VAEVRCLGFMAAAKWRCVFRVKTGAVRGKKAAGGGVWPATLVLKGARLAETLFL
jgi:hypothetical protein